MTLPPEEILGFSELEVELEHISPLSDSVLEPSEEIVDVGLDQTWCSAEQNWKAEI